MLPPVCAAVLAALLAAGCSTRAQNQAAPPPPVEVTEVAAADVPIYAEYPAQTYARNMVEVRGRVEGYIEKWLFKPGRRGSSKASRSTSWTCGLMKPPSSRPPETSSRPRRIWITPASRFRSCRPQANLAVAQANLVKAQQDYDRLKPLVEQDAAAKQDLDAATAALRAAEANVRANQANVDQARLQTATQIHPPKAKWTRSAGAGHRQAEPAIRHHPGAHHRPGGRYAGSGGRPGHARRRAAAHHHRAARPHLGAFQGQRVAIPGLQTQPCATDAARTPAGRRDQFPQRGHIENTLNQVDPKTGTLEFQASFPNPQHTLLPGQFGRVGFRPKTARTPSWCRSGRCSRSRACRRSTWWAPDNKVAGARRDHRRPVGRILDRHQGLQPGDRVVVEGQLRVRPGMLVHPVPYREARRRRGR